MTLPQINNANPKKIHEFSEKLLYSLQALDTMGKIKEMNGYVRVTLDKLQDIRAGLEADRGLLQRPRWSSCAVRNLTIDLQIVKLQKP